MKTQIPTELTDSERFVVGAAMTGEPHKASREEVIKFFEPIIAATKAKLATIALEQKRSVLRSLEMEDAVFENGFDE